MRTLRHPQSQGHSGRFAVARWAAVRAYWSDPLATQADVAERASTSQSAVSQVLTGLRAQLGELSRDRLARFYLASYPGSKGELSYWASALPVRVQAERLSRLGWVVSGDAVGELLVPWRVPTEIVAYAASAMSDAPLLDAGFVPVDSASDASVALVVQMADTALLRQSTDLERVTIAHPLHVAYDLIRLGGEDRAEVVEALLGDERLSTTRPATSRPAGEATVIRQRHLTPDPQRARKLTAMQLPINWQAYDGQGELMERLICNLLHHRYSKDRYPNSGRRRAAQGDHGVDFYVETDDGLDVFQVKAFTAGTLRNAGRRQQIAKSLARAATLEPRPRRWHLVTPIVVTEEMRAWFTELSRGQPFECVWEDQDSCDALVADYPQYAEYILGDGSTTYKRAINDLTALKDGLLAERPSQAIATMHSLSSHLDQLSPYYRFDLETHDGRRETIERIAQSAGQNGDDTVLARCVAFDEDHGVTLRVRPKYPEATTDEPITAAFTALLSDVVRAEATAELGGPASFEATVTSSLPADMPETRRALIQIRPLDTPSPLQRRAALTARSANGDALASLPLAVTPTYQQSLTTVTYRFAANEPAVEILLRFEPQSDQQHVLRSELGIDFRNRTALACRTTATVLRAAATEGASLHLELDHTSVLDLTQDPAAQETLANCSLWTEATCLLADIGVNLNTDYPAPPSHVCQHDVNDLRDIVTLLKGGPVSCPDLTLTIEVATDELEAFLTSCTGTDWEVVPSVDAVTWTFHTLTETIAVPRVHVHFRRCKVATRSTDGDRTRLELSPDGDRSRIFYHLNDPTETELICRHVDVNDVSW